MKNTTTGEWKADGGGKWVYTDTPNEFGDDVICDVIALPEQNANAHLIALAGNLAQKYSLDKLEAATERLREAWETQGVDYLPEAIDDFLRAITRQPAGEKQQTS